VSILTVVSAVAAAGSAVAGGLYANFSLRVMPRLAALPDAQGMAAMQQFNRNAVQAPFMVVFFGSALASGYTLWQVVARGERTVPELLLGTGSCLYLAGFVMTIVHHVPLNDRLAALAPTSPAGAELWRTFVAEWTPANSVRAALSLGGAAALAIGAVLEVARRA